MIEVKVIAVIPARMGSTRYPGKPLIKIEGIPMIEHVRRRTLLCSSFSDVIVATCDQKIYDVVNGYNGKVLMTSSKHIMASDRVAEVIEDYDCTHVINVQGDEILVMPDDLSAMVNSIKLNPYNNYWNAIAPIEEHYELSDTSIVKCVINSKNKIIYCSRDFSSLNFSDKYHPVYKILGILGYSRESLLKYSNLPRTPLETSQSIDQLRILENDLNLFSVSFSIGYPGINEPREVKLVEEILNSDKNQKKMLKRIL